jgi:RNA polymerase sigma-32 factor
LRNWSIVRTGTTSAQKSLFFNLRRLRARIADMSENGISPDNRAEVARILGVPERDVEQMASRLSAPDHSLNAALGDEAGAEWQDFLADEAEAPDERVMHAHDDAARTGLVRAAMASLSDREKLIVQQRHLGEDAITLEALGALLGVSKERVRQIEGVALAKLKRAVVDRIGDPVAAGYLG